MEQQKFPPIAKTSEQPKRKCFPFFIIRQFFCSVFLRLKYILQSPIFIFLYLRYSLIISAEHILVKCFDKFNYFHFIVSKIQIINE